MSISGVSGVFKLECDTNRVDKIFHAVKGSQNHPDLSDVQVW